MGPLAPPLGNNRSTLRSRKTPSMVAWSGSNREGTGERSGISGTGIQKIALTNVPHGASESPKVRGTRVMGMGWHSSPGDTFFIPRVI